MGKFKDLTGMKFNRLRVIERAGYDNCREDMEQKRGDGMSYIVPREKPNGCTNCIYMDRITYDCKLMYGDDYPDFEIQYKNCPLIEIPTPHGRLIDVDALKNDMRGWNPSIIAVVDATPTVIEAEGSEE